MAYTLTRTVGLPHAHSDIGNWAESAGVLSLLVEAAFVVLTVVQLRLPASGPTLSLAPSGTQSR
ncbi:hypothetical protein [Deinococcus aerophilus]|uniref:Uncharacterized protein n=1 Tax=Deinococcus aerophilus TaxID=522488 RepID=A0ABQ2GIL2_9DEIO|nr:hypothetical protein [Deinococcus aerophilus]GGL98120.1 hypothetical protein GCM10010841_03120 [Deinococcus aerophilus]